jgi:hypothetical protein
VRSEISDQHESSGKERLLDILTALDPPTSTICTSFGPTPDSCHIKVEIVIAVWLSKVIQYDFSIPEERYSMERPNIEDKVDH